MLATHRSLNSDPLYNPLYWQHSAEPEAVRSPAKPGVSRPSKPSTAAAPRPRTPAITDQGIIGLWDMRVEKKMAGGLSKRDAIRELVIEDPKFHGQYLDAYKRETQKGRRPAARRD